MEKLGVSQEILYSELRDEEAMLMQKMQEVMVSNDKTAQDHSWLESRLTQIRNKLTELDLKK